MADIAGVLKHATDQIDEAYYRLVLLVGPVESGKSHTLRQLTEQSDWPIINLNAELSRHLLEVSSKRRPLAAPRIVKELVDRAAGSGDATAVVLDGTQILFQHDLKLDTLRVLQAVSRNVTIVAEWLGEHRQGELLYAEPDHPEYRRYRQPDATIVTTGT